MYNVDNEDYKHNGENEVVIKNDLKNRENNISNETNKLMENIFGEDKNYINNNNDEDINYNFLIDEQNENSDEISEDSDNESEKEETPFIFIDDGEDLSYTKLYLPIMDEPLCNQGDDLMNIISDAKEKKNNRVTFNEDGDIIFDDTKNDNDDISWMFE